MTAGERLYVVTRLAIEDDDVAVVLVTESKEAAQAALALDVTAMDAEDQLDDNADPTKDDFVEAFGGMIVWEIHESILEVRNANAT